MPLNKLILESCMYKYTLKLKETDALLNVSLYSVFLPIVYASNILNTNHHIDNEVQRQQSCDVILINHITGLCDYFSNNSVCVFFPKVRDMRSPCKLFMYWNVMR